MITKGRSAATALALTLMAGCAAPATQAPTPKTVAGAPAAPQVRLSQHNLAYITVESVSKAPMKVDKRFFGRVTFAADRVAGLAAPVSGRVVSVSAVPGQRISVGDALLRIASPDVAAEQAARASAGRARVLAQQAADRAGRLYQIGSGSLAAKEAADEVLELAKIEDRRAEQALQAIGEPADGGAVFTLRAPIAGVVVDRNVEIGNSVSSDSDDVLVTLADLSRVWFVFDVHGTERAFVDVGDPLAVRINDILDRSFDGKVVYVGDVVDPTVQAARGRVELDNRDRFLRPGMFGVASVESAESPGVLVPKSAILADRDRFYVYAPGDDPGTFVRREITIGDDRDNAVVITAGLQPADRVVVRGAILLDAEAGQLIMPSDDQSDAPPGA